MSQTIVYGPYKCKDNRLRCVTKNLITGEMSSISYPRIVYEQETGIKLNVFDDIHHKDENPLNNDFNNLCVVKHVDHMKEHRKYKENTDVVCVWCENKFVLNPKQQAYRSGNSKKNKKGPFCSRSCSGKYGTFIQHYGHVVQR